MTLRQRWLWTSLACAVAVSYAWLATSASIARHRRFETAAFDLGIFDQTIWGYSRLRLVDNTVKGSGNLLGDHFHPLLAVFAPVYWAWDSPEALLMIQAVSVAASSLWIFAASRRLPEVALMVQTSYLSSWMLLNGVLFDFHEYAIATPILGMLLYGLMQNSWRFSLTGTILLCLLREDLVLIGAAVGVLMIFRNDRRRGIAVSTLSSLWFVCVICTIIPAISGHSYGYMPRVFDADHAAQASASVSFRIHEVVHFFGRTGECAVTLLQSIVSWSLIPILSPLFLLSLPIWLVRLAGPNPKALGTDYHYSMVVAPILAFATIDTILRYDTAGMRRVVARSISASVLAASVVSLVWLGDVKALSLEVSGTAGIKRCLAMIPKHESVAATENLLPHLTHRQSAYTLLTGLDRDHTPRYVALQGSTIEKRPGLVHRTEARGYVLICMAPGVWVLEARRR